MQEEIFGPVCAIAKFKTKEDAIRIGNSSTYGLAAAVSFSGRPFNLPRVTPHHTTPPYFIPIPHRQPRRPFLLSPNLLPRSRRGSAAFLAPQLPIRPKMKVEISPNGR